ncbi:MULTISPECIES: glycoside hydrolase family 35 protein [unclassified Isoptericola]|uniref:glycoside hydrolase family 35 protein n=1 Tax=unclassified Isoptericola TaxID=2623355 RepID=UPI00366432CC
MKLPADLRLPMISGAFHYARVHPDQWEERLQLLRAMGLDTVETYVPWNFHEPRRGEYRFDGIADLGRFLDLAGAVGLRAIVRPGPYSCAEWDNGGLPAWLTGVPGLRIRTADEAFLAAVDDWFDVLVPMLVERQSTRGGNVCLVQIENEYGSFGTDRSYLEHLRIGLAGRGIDVPLFTSDGGSDSCLTGGTLPGVWATVNFGSNPEQNFDALRRHRPDDPLFCMEYWHGWFDHWGAHHHVRDAGDAADVLDRMLATGASVNLYMAHGGTSFGCSAGANDDGRYLPTVTSYDYDAPIDEAGRPTAKFWAFREVIGRYRDLPPLQEVAEPATLPTTQIRMTGAVPLANVLDAASRVVAAPSPPTFEELGLAHGLVRYRCRVAGPRPEAALTFPGLGDRAHVYADGRLLGIVWRDDDAGIPLAVPAEGVTLEVVVESMGRVNYGTRIGERKGLVGGVRHGLQYLHGWEVTSVELPDLPNLPQPESPAAASTAADASAPAFVQGAFDAISPAGGFVALEGWGKGYVWVNGFCLGRYWERGPQRTLYLPAPVVREGRNEVVVLELDRIGGAPRVVDRPDLGPTD